MAKDRVEIQLNNNAPNAHRVKIKIFGRYELLLNVPTIEQIVSGLLNLPIGTIDKLAAYVTIKGQKRKVDIRLRSGSGDLVDCIDITSHDPEIESEEREEYIIKNIGLQRQAFWQASPKKPCVLLYDSDGSLLSFKFPPDFPHRINPKFIKPGLNIIDFIESASSSPLRKDTCIPIIESIIYTKTPIMYTSTGINCENGDKLTYLVSIMPSNGNRVIAYVYNVVDFRS